MKKLVLACSLALTSLAFAPATWAVAVGDPAPDFKATASDGKTYELSQLKGKYVVLEWHNQGCPFVKKHYGSGNMQKLQKELTAKGVAWLTVISSAKGKQGYVDAKAANQYVAEQKAAPTAVLLDPMGKVGHLYEAKTTPHMFVVDPKGTLIYAGAIDDKDGTDPAEIAGARNYVRAAFEESSAGRKVSVPSSRPYGCGVKYE